MYDTRMSERGRITTTGWPTWPEWAQVGRSILVAHGFRVTTEGIVSSAIEPGHAIVGRFGGTYPYCCFAPVGKKRASDLLHGTGSHWRDGARDALLDVGIIPNEELISVQRVLDLIALNGPALSNHLACEEWCEALEHFTARKKSLLTLLGLEDHG